MLRAYREIKRLRLLELDETKSDPELERSILVDTLGGSVSAFDALGKKLREVAPQVFPAHPRNLFQNFSALDAALRANSRSIADRLGGQERAFRLQLLLQVRHIVEHNLGVVDDDFIRNVPTHRSMRGRLYPLTLDEVDDLLVLLSDLAGTLQRDFQPPASPSPEALT